MAVEDQHSDEDRGGERRRSSSGTAAEDEELTSLAWLQDADLLKNFRMGAYGIEGEGAAGGDCSSPPSSDYLDEAAENVVTVAGDEQQQQEEEEEQNVEPPTPGGHSPYNPALHAHSKPPFSFSCLIFMAIEDSPRKALPVKDIYGWILARFPYFQAAPSGWKNSVRHNLSLSKCFRKVDKEKGQNVGKGSLWCIDPEFRPNLLQALQKAPSMANLEFLAAAPSSPHHHHNGTTADRSEIKPCLLVSSQEAIQIPPPELFPFLSRRLASSIKDPEVDAAATMLTLKNGPDAPLSLLRSKQDAFVSDESENESIQVNPKFSRKRLRLKQSVAASHHGTMPKRSRPKPVITNSPSEDHTYSACLEEGDDNNNNNLPNDNNAEEEGAHALMNLAEMASRRLLRKVKS